MSMDTSYWSTWRAGMRMFGPLWATQTLSEQKKEIRDYYKKVDVPPQDYLAAYPELAPLGDRVKIERFILNILDEISEARDGDLPAIREIPVTGSNQPLLVPTDFSPEEIRSIEEAAVEGVGALENLIRNELPELRRFAENPERVQQEAEAEWDAFVVDVRAMEREYGTRDNPAEAQIPAMTHEERREVLDHVDRDEEVPGAAQSLTVTRQVAKYAAFCSSVVDVVDSFSEIEGGRGITTAVQVLEAVESAATICASICLTLAATISSASGALGWVGFALTILALLAAFVSWIVSWFDHQYGSIWELGWKQDWNGPALRLTIGERLRVLCQCEEDAILPAVINAWTHAQSGGDDWDNRKEMLRWMLQAMSGEPPSDVDDDMRMNAIGICRLLGRSVDPSRPWAEAEKLASEIRTWLLYVGADPDEVDVIYQWIVEAHKVTVVNAREIYLNTLQGSARCSDDEWPDLATRDRCELVGGKGLNAGSVEWFRTDKDLPMSRWKRLTIDDIRAIHASVQQLITYAEANPWESVRQTTLTTSLTIPGGANWCRDREPPAVVVPVGEYVALVYPELIRSSVRVPFRANYVPVEMHGEYLGCIIAIRELWDRSFTRLHPPLPPQYGVVELLTDPSCIWAEQHPGVEVHARACIEQGIPGWGRDTTDEPCVRPIADAFRLIAGPKPSGETTVPMEEVRGALRGRTASAHQDFINSREFTDQLRAALASYYPSPMATAGKVLLGTAAAVGLGYAAYKILV